MVSIKDVKENLIKILEPVLKKYFNDELPITAEVEIDVESIVNKIEFYPDLNKLVVK